MNEKKKRKKGEKLPLTAKNINEIFDVEISAVIKKSTEYCLRIDFHNEDKSPDFIPNYGMRKAEYR